MRQPLRQVFVGMPVVVLVDRLGGDVEAEQHRGWAEQRHGEDLSGAGKLPGNGGGHCGPGVGGLPLSNTTRQRFGPSRRQIELKRAIALPDGSRTRPVLRASVPEASTST